MGATRVYEPPAGSPNVTDVDVDVLADGSVREVVRTVLGPGVIQPGSVSNVIPGQTDVVAQLLAQPGLVLRGFSVLGTGDGKAQLTVDGNVVGHTVLSALKKDATVTLPVPYAVVSGATVQVVIVCSGTGSCDYEAAIYGEVVPS